MYDLSALLRGNAYPGRGVLLGRSEDGKSAVIAYFIMGRSENSRNRIFVETEDGIRTQAYDPAKMTDPSLIIYHPVRRVADEEGVTTLVTNGDQTDTLRDFMLEGGSYVEALNTREFEPDGPNYTPRISGILFPCGSYVLSILKSLSGITLPMTRPKRAWAISSTPMNRTAIPCPLSAASPGLWPSREIWINLPG